MKVLRVLLLVFVVLVVLTALSSVYVIAEGEQAVITQFGRPVKAVTDAGPNFKLPFVQNVHRFEKRLLPWDGEPQNMPTRDKRRIYIDVWARWRIVDPMKFYKAVGSESSGQQRLDELVDSAVRGVIANNNLIDAVRTTDNPLKYETKELEEDWAARRDRVTTGRREIEQKIQDVASRDLEATYGMELVEVHLKRINYIQSVRDKVYERMRSERMRIASLFESEAEEEKNRILGHTRKELDEIEGEMEQRSAEIRGEAEARVIEITARAFGKAPQFYQFLRQLNAYKKTFGDRTRLILSTDNAFLRQLDQYESGEADLAADVGRGVETATP